MLQVIDIFYRNFIIDLKNKTNNSLTKDIYFIIIIIKIILKYSLIFINTN